jgi:hydrogenase maturation protease
MRTRARIVCLGNRLLECDSAGPRVHDLLVRAPLPEGVELVDGGIAGLSLLPLADGAERLIFVDQSMGWAQPGQVVRIDAAELASEAHGAADHGAGLPHLLAAIPLACDGVPPQLEVVVLEGPVHDAAVQSAAALALSLAQERGERA